MAGLIIFVVFFQLMALANGSEILAPDNFWGFLFWLGVFFHWSFSSGPGKEGINDMAHIRSPPPD